MTNEKPKRNKSPGINQIPTEFIKSWSRKFRSEIHKLINSIWNTEELLEEWKELVFLSIYKNSDKTDCSN
jgi:hypothetical protein